MDVLVQVYTGLPLFSTVPFVGVRLAFQSTNFSTSLDEGPTEPMRIAIVDIASGKVLDSLTGLKQLMATKTSWFVGNDSAAVFVVDKLWSPNFSLVTDVGRILTKFFYQKLHEVWQLPNSQNSIRQISASAAKASVAICNVKIKIVDLTADGQQNSLGRNK